MMSNDEYVSTHLYLHVDKCNYNYRWNHTHRDMYMYIYICVCVYVNIVHLKTMEIHGVSLSRSPFYARVYVWNVSKFSGTQGKAMQWNAMLIPYHFTPSISIMILLYHLTWHRGMGHGDFWKCVFMSGISVNVCMWCACIFVLLQSFACVSICIDTHGPSAHVIGIQEPICDHLPVRYI